MTARSPYLDQSRLLRYLNSPVVVWLSRFPPIRWLTNILISISSRGLKRRSLSTPTESQLETTLDMIVRDVVTNFGYVGAMLATRGKDDSLPVRAYYLDPLVMTQEQIERW